MSSYRSLYFLLILQLSREAQSFLPLGVRSSTTHQRHQHRQHAVLTSDKQVDSVVDVAIIGAGIGGLTAAAILSYRYNLKVGVYESHYRPGGCAHSFPIKSKSGNTYNFDAGPTIMLGCSSFPFNPLQQCLSFVDASKDIEWLSYKSWGMVTEDGSWNFELGENAFVKDVLPRFGGPTAVTEFRNLQKACAPLCAGAAGIPTVALRGDKYRLLPLLGHLSALQKVIPYSVVLDGSFRPLLVAHVTDPWLLSWLNALAFSLSGLPAAETGAAALAYTVYDLHRDGSALDYPKGGMGKIADVLVDVITRTGGEVCLSTPVRHVHVEDGRAAGVVVQPVGKPVQLIKARKGVICNANVWALPSLLQPVIDQLDEKQRSYFLRESAEKIATKSFTHLHLGLDSSGLDRTKWKAHYTVMDKGLHVADPCADRNMVAVSNPSMLDNSLVTGPDGLPSSSHILVHAYGAGNEPYDPWRIPPKMSLSSNADNDYERNKEESSRFLYRSIARALMIPEQEVRERADVAMVGTPHTHARYLRRHEGTYGAVFNSMLPGPTTPLPGLLLCGDSVFPGIGVPAVAVSGANCANTCVSVVRHMVELLKS